MKLGPTPLVVATLAAEAIISASASSSHLSNNALHHRGLLNKMKRAVGAKSGDSQMEARSSSSSELEKRQTYSGTATWYVDDRSEGACGPYSSPSDYIVAMNLPNYGNQDAVSSWCGKKLDISYGGITRTATVVDCCATCHSDGDLDMSTGLFTSFGVSIGTGEFDITWSVAGSGGSSNSNNDDSPTTTHHSSHTHTTPTSTSTKQPITSTILSTITLSTSTSLSTSTGVAAATVTTPSVSTGTSSSTTSTQGTAQNVQDISDVFAGLLNIANAVQK